MGTTHIEVCASTSGSTIAAEPMGVTRTRQPSGKNRPGASVSRLNCINMAMVSRRPMGRDATSLARTAAARR